MWQSDRKPRSAIGGNGESSGGVLRSTGARRFGRAVRASAPPGRTASAGSARAQGDTAPDSRPSTVGTLDPVRQPVFFRQLVEVRGERDRGGQPQRPGRVRPDRVQQLPAAAQPFVERAHERPLALEAVLAVFAQLGVTVGDRRSVSGADDREVIAGAEALQRGQVGGQRALVGGDEHAPFAEHRVTAEARVGCQQGEVVGGVAGRRDRLEGAEALAVAQPHVGRSGRGRQRRPVGGREGGGALAVVGVAVGHRHAPEAAPLLDGLPQPREVRLVRRPRVDDPRRGAPHHPGVGPAQRERARVGREHPRDPPLGEQLGFGVAHARLAITCFTTV